MAGAEVYGRPFPGRAPTGPVRPGPDRGRVRRELARVGVTLKRPHRGHRDEVRAKGEPPMSCGRFRKCYRESWTGTGREGHRMYSEEQRRIAVDSSDIMPKQRCVLYSLPIEYSGRLII